MRIRPWLRMWVMALLWLPEVLAQSLELHGSGIPGTVLGVPSRVFEDGMFM